MSGDGKLDIEGIKKEIQEILGLNTENIKFDFSQDQGVTLLNLITVSPRHEQSFLLHTVKAIDQIEALQKMLDYVKLQHSEENTYTIQWSINGKDELQTSYFSAKSMYDALDKFNYNRDLNACTIFSINLNPIA